MKPDLDPIHDSASPFTPPDTGTTPTLLIALVLAVLVVAGLWLNNWWTSGSEAAAPPASAVAPNKPAASKPQPSNGSSRPSTAVASRPAWSRCELGGKVVYSDVDCPANAVKSTADNTHAALSSVPSAPNRPGDGVTTIYRCKSYSGVVFWSSKHCHEQKALVDRMVTVPSGLAFREQIAVAERLVPAQRVGPPAVVNRAIVLSDEKTKKCKELNERIRRIDAVTRQPQSGLEQDRLRGERRDLRDRQFALRC